MIKYPVLWNWQKPTLPRYVNRSILHEDFAKYNHSQTLDQLARRGGLAPIEIYMNHYRIPLTRMSEIAEDAVLKFLIENQYIDEIDSHLPDNFDIGGVHCTGHVDYDPGSKI